MAKYRVEEFIERLPFFKEFSDSERMKLVNSSGIFEKFKMDEIICEEGDMDSSVYVILTGTVKIRKNPKTYISESQISINTPDDFTIAELKEGSIFGEVPLISKNLRQNSVIASSREVVVMKITNEVFQQFHLDMQRKFQSHLINILVQRLNEMNEKYIKLKVSK